MLGIERFQLIRQGKLPDRVPFVPTVYEHAASLIGVTPSEMAQRADLIVKGQLKAYDMYKHDLLAVGVDIYNLEAEALGCKVCFFSDDNVPAIASNVIERKEDLLKLKLLDPESAGRLPLLLDAASQIKEEVGHQVPVNGAVVGPFTLAAILRGYENFVNDMITDPVFAHELLGFTTLVGAECGKGMIRRSLGVSVNESWISPPLLSPALYKAFAFPYEKQLIQALKEAGGTSIGLISGGNTTSIVEGMIETGTSLVMGDWGCDLSFYKTLAQKAGIILRGSIQSRLLENGSLEEIALQAEKVLEIGMPGGNFILGCGVLPFGASPEKVLFLKQIVKRYRYREEEQQMGEEENR